MKDPLAHTHGRGTRDVQLQAGFAPHFEFGRSWGIRRTEQAKSYVPRPNGHAAIKLFLSGSKRSRLAHEGGDALGVKRRAETSAAYRDGALGSEAVGG